MSEKNIIKLSITAAVILLTMLFVYPTFIHPRVNVWRKEMGGKAQLAEAKFNKQIQIEDAKGRLEAEKLNAQSEVERAKGAAKSIEVEAGKLTPQYIQYLWVRQLDLSKAKTIYIPTEAGLPILEAGKRK